MNNSKFYHVPEKFLEKEHCEESGPNKKDMKSRLLRSFPEEDIPREISSLQSTVDSDDLCSATLPLLLSLRDFSEYFASLPEKANIGLIQGSIRKRDVCAVNHLIERFSERFPSVT